MAVREAESRHALLTVAEDEARSLRHDYIGSEHLLLALLRDQRSELARVFEELGLTHSGVMTAVIDLNGWGDTPESGTPLALNEEARRLWEEFESSGESRAVLALALTDTGIVLDAFKLLGVNPERVRQAMRDLARPDESASEVEVKSATDGDPATSRSTAEPESGAEPDQTTDQKAAPTPLETVPTHLDQPAEVDRLKRRGLAEILADRIRRTRGEAVGAARGRDAGDTHVQRGSFLIHISAPWGGGKSSLLNFIAEELGSPRDPELTKWIVVRFSAWQHQRVAPPWWWLMAAVRRDIREQLTGREKLVFMAKDLRWRLWNARPALFAVVLIAGLVAVAWATGLFDLAGSPTALKVLSASAGIIALGTLLWQAVRGISRWLMVGSADAAGRLLKRVHDPMEVFRDRFHNLLDAAGHPVVIFIDDLDRCRSDYVVELLEGIQTLFVEENATYVVAADRQWLCDSFASTYTEFSESVAAPGAPLGFLFLEKTFQISLDLPPITPEVRGKYWSRLLHERARDEDDAADYERLRVKAELALVGLHSEQAIVDKLEELEAQEGSQEAQSAEAEVLRKVAAQRLISQESETELKHALQEFADLLEENPRAMKRLVNAYGIERARRVRDGDKFDAEERKRSVLWMIVKLRWPLLAEHLAREPDQIKALKAGALLPGMEADSELGRLFTNPRVQTVVTGGNGKLGVDLDRATIVGYVRPKDDQHTMAVGA